MKHYSHFFSKEIFTYINAEFPSIQEEVLLRTAKRIAEQKELKNIIQIVEHNSTFRNPFIVEILEKFGEVRFVSENQIKPSARVVCLESHKDLFQSPVVVPNITSGEQLIESVLSSDFEQFRKSVFNSLREIDVRSIFNNVRVAHNLDPIVEKINFETDSKREDFYNGKFSVGQIVESKGSHYEVLDRGSNYLVVVDAHGGTSKRWVTDCNESSIETIHVADEFSYKGYTPKSEFHSDTVVTLQTLFKENTDPFLVLNTFKSLDNINESDDKLEELLSKLSLEEDQETADYKTDKDGRKYRARRIVFKNSKEEVKESKQSTVFEPNKAKGDNISQGIISGDDFKKFIQNYKTAVNTVGNSTHKDSAASEDRETHIRRMKIKHVHESEDPIELSDSEIDAELEKINHLEDIIDVYEDDEIAYIDKETNEDITDELEEPEGLNEVLTRMERIKAKTRFARTKAKRERAIQIALKKHSDSKVINKRARKLAINILKKKIAKKDLSKLSLPEKERIERIIEKSKRTVDRIAMKMVPKIRKIENERLEK